MGKKKKNKGSNQLDSKQDSNDHVAIIEQIEDCKQNIIENNAQVQSNSEQVYRELTISKIIKIPMISEVLLNTLDVIPKPETIYSIIKKGDLNAVKLYLEDKNHNVNDKNDLGRSLLYTACEFTQMDIVKFLLDNNADINVQNGKGYAAIHIAISKGNKEIIELLLKHKANVNIVDNQNRSSLDIANIYLEKNSNNKDLVDIKELLVSHEAKLGTDIISWRKIVSDSKLSKKPENTK